jgi:hypothetical protein
MSVKRRPGVDFTEISSLNWRTFCQMLFVIFQIFVLKKASHAVFANKPLECVDEIDRHLDVYFQIQDRTSLIQILNKTLAYLTIQLFSSY